MVSRKDSSSHQPHTRGGGGVQRRPKSQGSSHTGAQVVSIEQCIKWFFENDIPLNKDDCALLKRWFDDDRAGKVWSTIRAHAERQEGPFGADAPIYFINFILEVKRAAEHESKRNADIAAMTAEIGKLEIEEAKKICRVAKQVPSKERGAYLKRAGERLVKYPSADISPPRIRSDHDGSRARAYFMRDVSGYVCNVTGKWLDVQVAVLAQVAFGVDDDVVGAETVRKARSNKAAMP